MTDDKDWYFDLSDHTVQQGKAARGANRLGPYPTKAAAEQALEIARARNKAADDSEDRWND